MEQTIYRYCLHITHNQWDAEDLSQEVLFKVYKVVKSDPSRILSKAYLYRIAANAWKDKMKMDKRRIQTTDMAFNDSSFHDGELSTRELLEALAHRLSPRALVILLLMDVFDFTAKETAEFLSQAEGTIQVTLGRARLRLKKLAHRIETASADPFEREVPKPASQMDLDSLVEAFKQRDLSAICRCYLKLVKIQVKISNIQLVNGRIAFYIEDPDGNQFMVTEKIY
ncbi:RNA polymerase sigma factor [Paenibacillus qinlingensis]|uniref:RNA polymerase sigma-70 factor (ECF subfamily) n=1 Tax=Paenibacillus qinlingensis TaxID=1837343 RepID=A0ABU1NWF4_9BACL|nr:RNA polymerase sigma factor [Paenibacillus qinlingensis]MDR6551804.1 RNA polymerase sigma-70 factor (ECF subfamily) [Paenibacillus qinlingensis]